MPERFVRWNFDQLQWLPECLKPKYSDQDHEKFQQQKRFLAGEVMLCRDKLWKKFGMAKLLLILLPTCSTDKFDKTRMPQFIFLMSERLVGTFVVVKIRTPPCLIGLCKVIFVRFPFECFGSKHGVFNLRRIVGPWVETHLNSPEPSCIKMQ